MCAPNTITIINQQRGKFPSDDLRQVVYAPGEAVRDLVGHVSGPGGVPTTGACMADRSRTRQVWQMGSGRGGVAR